MIRVLASRSISAFNLPKLAPTTYHLATSAVFSPWQIQSKFLFSEERQRQPRNKQEAWMMQEQKNLKSAPLQDEQEIKTYDGVSKVGIAGFILLTSALMYMLWTAQARSKKNLDFLEDDISGLKELKEEESLVGGSWTLVNTDGQPFSNRNLEGSYYLIFFGYTKCPDVCPSTLYYLSSVYRIIRNLPQGAYIKFKLVFVSVDPERDTPKVVKDYLKNFGRHIVGVTGSSPNDIQLKECMKKFRIRANKIEREGLVDKSKYDIDHTTRVYLMDPSNKYLMHLDPTLTEQQTAKAIVGKIIQNDHKMEKANQATGL